MDIELVYMFTIMRTRQILKTPINIGPTLYNVDWDEVDFDY